MGNHLALILGAIYQFVFVAILLSLAIKVFTSDKLFTLGVIIASRRTKLSRRGRKSKESV